MTPTSNQSNPSSQDKLDIPTSPTYLSVPPSPLSRTVPAQPVAKSPPITINKPQNKKSFFNMRKHFKSLMNDVKPVPENSSVESSKQQSNTSKQGNFT
jgi:hypothetical protein